MPRFNAMFYATSLDARKLREVLVVNSAAIHDHDTGGFSLLHAVIFSSKESNIPQALETLQVLFDNHIDPLVKNRRGHRVTALEFAKVDNCPAAVIDALINYEQKWCDAHPQSLANTIVQPTIRRRHTSGAGTGSSSAISATTSYINSMNFQM